ncbi:MAG: N-acetylmuramoyl-L-alanine amidase [Deltaproteobacteria bacterium]|nr:N-acetylmuramoyl-L-alanine amidase [Deltaproteobacteria bacterium]
MRSLTCNWKTIGLILFICGMLAVPSAATARPLTVFVDPAHGGDDRGVELDRGDFEKELTLDVAKEIENRFRGNRDISIILTRNGDETVPVERRRTMAREKKADLFISLHINAGFGAGAAGYEIYFSDGSWVRKQGESGDIIIEDMIENRIRNDSIRLAQIIEYHIGSVFPRQGRGLRSSPVLILSGMENAGILVEFGFGTNVKDRKKLLDPNIREAIARAVCDGIQAYNKGREKQDAE